MFSNVLSESKLKPIGIVECPDYSDAELKYGQSACIKVFQEYSDALSRFEEHDYYWIICWLDKADRCVLQKRSFHRDNSDETPYGMFSMRAPCRPNPISLTLVKIVRRDGNNIYLDGLDVFNGTYVLDIKPYFSADIVFSPKAPYMRPKEKADADKLILKKALNHHKEACGGLALAVRMSEIAENIFSSLFDDDLKLDVSGPPCFADALQGITGARLANPARFFYQFSNGFVCIWQDNEKQIRMEVNDINIAALPFEEIMKTEYPQLFTIESELYGQSASQIIEFADLSR